MSKTIEIKIERVIPASPSEVYAAWLNPKIPGTPWSEANKLILNPKVNALWYWYISGTPHYGLFTKLERGSKIQHTWISPYTKGLESIVTITFKKKGSDTVMTLHHKGLPNDADGRGHNDGWNYFVEKFAKKFASRKGKK